MVEVPAILNFAGILIGFTFSTIFGRSSRNLNKLRIFPYIFVIFLLIILCNFSNTPSGRGALSTQITKTQEQIFHIKVEITCRRIFFPSELVGFLFLIYHGHLVMDFPSHNQNIQRFIKFFILLYSFLTYSSTTVSSECSMIFR